MSLLTTDRLVLRPLTETDLHELHQLFLDPEVRRFLLDGEEMPRTFTRRVIEDSIVGFSDPAVGVGIWAVCERQQGEAAGTPTILGFVGFREFFEPPELQLLYGFLPIAWGKGFATEAARAVIDFAFDRCGFTEVIAATDPPNHASVRVMERLGLGHREVIEREGKPTVYTRVSCEEWSARKEAASIKPN